MALIERILSGGNGNFFLIAGPCVVEGEEITLRVHGSGFLYNMVRIIAGTLRDIGSGKLAPGALRRAIDTGDRLDLGVTAPAHGLTLMEVFYDLPEAAGRMSE